MPTEPELGITAPCRLWCTLVALFTSCNRSWKVKPRKIHQKQSTSIHQLTS